MKNGTMKEISVKGRKILLVRVDAQCYATDNRCPHMGANLSQGKLEGTVVTCPKHNSQFDLKDDRVACWWKGSGFISTVDNTLKSPHALVTYNVKVQNNKILREI